jgi:hypothetical protein
MARSPRRSRIIAAVAASAIGLSMSATTLGSSAATAAPEGHGQAASRLAPPGPFGSRVTLEDQAFYYGVDVAIDPSSNTAYVGWIGDNVNNATTLDVHLCVLPLKASTCSGGIRTIDTIGPSAAGLQVEVTGPGEATLVWWHQAVGTGKLSKAIYSGGVLAAGADVTDAPSNGMLFDVVRAPDGQLWAVTRDGGTGTNLQVRPGLTGTPQNASAPWMVGNASLAFAGTKPILLIAEYGPISDPVYYATGTPWGSFKAVPKTWNLGVFNDMVTTKSGVRMISSENNANYRPVVGKWTGTAFSTPKLVGENKSCPALTFDLVTDASGRLSNVSERCGKLGIYNHPQTSRAAIKYFDSGGTIGGAPQIGTTARGYGLVAWAIQSPTAVANKLFARWVRLPSLLAAKSAKAQGNKVTVKGPIGCLTPVTIQATVKANAAPGWSVVSRQLKLDGDNVGRSVDIDGEKLASGSTHVLVGKAVFKKGGQRATATKRFEFKVC